MTTVTFCSRAIIFLPRYVSHCDGVGVFGGVGGGIGVGGVGVGVGVVGVVGVVVGVVVVVVVVGGKARTVYSLMATGLVAHAASYTSGQDTVQRYLAASSLAEASGSVHCARTGTAVTCLLFPGAGNSLRCIAPIGVIVPNSIALSHPGAHPCAGPESDSNLCAHVDPNMGLLRLYRRGARIVLCALPSFPLLPAPSRPPAILVVIEHCRTPALHRT